MRNRFPTPAHTVVRIIQMQSHPPLQQLRSEFRDFYQRVGHVSKITVAKSNPDDKHLALALMFWLSVSVCLSLFLRLSLSVRLSLPPLSFSHFVQKIKYNPSQYCHMFIIILSKKNLYGLSEFDIFHYTGAAPAVLHFKFLDSF